MFLLKRNDFYYVQFTSPDGKKKRVSTKSKDKTEAKKFLSAFASTPQSEHTAISTKFDDFKNEYLEYTRKTKSRKYYKSIELSLGQFYAFIGNKDMKDISVRLAEKFLLDRYTSAPYSAHLYLRTMKAAFNHALRWSFISFNPFKQIKLPKLPKKIPLFLTHEELEKVKAAIPNDTIRDMVEFDFHTGLRLSELTNLRWQNVDLENRRIIIANTEYFRSKNQRDRVIPLNDVAYKILLRQISIKEGYVFQKANSFPFAEDHLSKSFKKAIRTLKFDDRISYHTIRHSFASNLARTGVPILIIKELLGHENISTTQIYSHVMDSDLQKAVQKLAR